MHFHIKESDIKYWYTKESENSKWVELLFLKTDFWEILIKFFYGKPNSLVFDRGLLDEHIKEITIKNNDGRLIKNEDLYGWFTVGRYRISN